MSSFEIPVIQPFQLDSGGDGTVDNGVNLFRGNVSFFLKLVSLKGRNGLNVNLSALYESNVQRQVDRWNLDAPTGIIGLGWELPIETIESTGPETGALEDRVYDYVSSGSSNRLHRSAMRWKRGVLQSGFSVDLDATRITGPLQQSFASQALQLSANAQVTVLETGRSWRIVDPTSETIFEIEEASPSLSIYDGGLAYELLSYKPWRIRYYLEFERWEITRENGVTAVFGGNVQQQDDTSKTSLGDSIKWGVRWGNWVGSSALTHNPNNPSARVQQQYPVAWNHSRAYTLWGDEVLFDYEQVRQQVGREGLAYTKACYLSAVTDVFGRKVQLIYGDKIYDTSGPGAAREYQDPNKSPPSDQPDAFQSCYETKYLREIHVAAANGAALYQLLLESSPVSYATLPAGSPPNLVGDTQKRTLHSITKRLTNGLAPPPTLFTYNSVAETNRGALKSVTYPKGAAVTYRYQEKQLALCSRSESITNPLGAGATPRVWFGTDYAVIAWYAEGVLSIDVYSWLGRWQRWTPPRPQLNVYLDLDRLNVAVQEDFFVLYYEAQNGESTQFWVFHKDVLRLGEWLPYSENPLVHHSSQVTVATGTRFFAIAEQLAGEVSRYRWDELTKAWSTDTVTDMCTISDPSQTHIFVTALNNYLLTFCYDRFSAPGSKRSLLTLAYLDELGQWIKADQVTVPDLQIAENPNDPGDRFKGFFHWSPDASFVACTHVTKDLTSVREYAVTVFSWQVEDGQAYRLTAPKEFPYQVLKTAGGDLTVPWVAEVRVNNLIASGPHLLRYNGNDWLSNDNLKVLSQIDANTAIWFAYGPDVVVKTENSASNVIGALQAFDPNNDVTTWQSRLQQLYNGAPEGDYKTSYFPTSAPDFVSWDVQLYYRGSSTDWVKPLANPLQPGLPQGIDTTSVINQASSFLAYYGGSQSPTEVEVLRNGRVEKTTSLQENFFRVSQSSGAAAPGTVPAGPASFLTFLPVDGEFDHADSITLNRLVDDSINDVFIDYPIAVVDIGSGFGRNSTSYAFSEKSALCDSTGTVVKYFESTVFPGTDNALAPTYGRTTHYFINGLPPEQGSDGSQYPSVVDGFPHRTVSYDAEGSKVVENVLTWDVRTTVTDLFSGAADQPIFGAFARLGGVSTTKDGVTKSLQYDYVAATGLPRSTQSVIYNADGVPETRVSAKVYGYEVYDWLRNAHILSPPVQLKRTVALTGEAPTVTSVRVTTWKAFARVPLAGLQGQVFAAYRTYRWLGGSETSDFNFAAWTDHTATSDWLKTSEVKVRTLVGKVTERADPAGSVRSTLFDAAQRFPVALFTDASLAGQEAFYYGFESYECNGGWVLDTTATPIVTGNAHTGTQSLKLPGGSATTALRLAPKTPTTYLFSCWAKTPSDYDSRNPAGWRIQCTSGSSQPEVSQLAFAGSQGEWSYYYYEIVVDPAAPVEIDLTAFNSGTVPVYIDSVAFATAIGQYVASVYEEPTHLITAETGPYNNSLQWIYNQHLQTIARTGHGGEVKSLSLSYFARQNSPGTFDPSEPNSTLLLLPTGSTFHDRFSAGGDWTAHWNSAQAADWQAVDGWLLHTTDQAGRISLTTPAFSSNYFVYVDVKVGEEITAPIGLEVGASLAVAWSPKSQTWVLELSGKAENKVVQAPYTSTGPGNSWLLVMTDHAILFYVDGRMTCGCAVSDAISGAPAINTSNRVGFATFLVGGAPEIGVAFVDGSGKTHQRQTIDGTGVVVSANLYDDLGRAAVVTKSARYEDPIPKYQASFAKLDWSSGFMTGDVCTANPADGPFPFHRKRYEASPLGRVVEVGLPGEVFAVGKEHTTRFEYGSNQLNGFPSVLKLPSGQYFMVKAINPDGVVSVVIADVLGRNVAQGTLVDTETNRYVMSSMSQHYTIDGRVVTHFLPNYYNPPDPAQKDRWILTQPYDMLGRVLSRSGPNSGVTKYIYDIRGNLRFAQDAAAAEQGIVVYTIYDQLGQMRERGTFAFKWDAALLDQQANNPSWPGIAQGAKPRYRYKYTHSGDDPNQFGRLTGVEVVDNYNSAGSSDQVVFVYNQANQLESEAVSSPRYGDEVYTFTYGYDNLGRGSFITYPSGIVFRTQRNPLGRVQSIATSERMFASYEYYLSGQVKTETLNPGSSDAIARQYSYNSPGWLTAIDDGLFRETIGYTENGYGGTGYYTGQIANVQSDFAIGNPGEFPTSTNYEYAYDALSRLQVAQCSIDGRASQDLSVGTQSPVTYDDNGNFLTFEQGSQTEQYRYQPGTDFVTNSTGSQNVDYESSPNGAVTAAKPRGISLITYDQIINKATQIKLSSGDEVRFDYDVHGRRCLKIDSEQTRLYLSGRNLRPLSEKVRRQGGGPETTLEYVYGPTGVLGLLGADGYSTLLRDHLGSTRAVVGAAKTPQAAYHYQPFGQLLDPVFGNKEAVRYLFTGYEFDSQTGLYNAGARLYDPALRRFYSVDPAHQFASPYVYAGNNPIVMVDPTGTVSAAAIAIGTVVTVIGVIAAIFTFGVSAALAVGADVADAAAEGIAVGLDAGEAGEAAEAAATGLTVGEKVGVGALNVASGTLLGAGTGGVQYGATHNGFNGREFGEALGVGALSGAVSGGLGYGISALDGLVLDQAISSLSSSLAKVASTALRSGLESAVAALPGQVISNAVSHDPLGEGMLSAFGTSFAEGAAFGALDGLLSMGRVGSDPAAAHDEGAEAAAPPPPPPHDGQGNGDHDAPAAHQGEGENAQADAPGNQCRALILYRPPSRVFSPDFGLQALQLQSSIPRLFRLDLPPPPPIVLDLPNARITFLDQSRFNLPPKVTVEFYTYPALTWYESGTAAGEMIH